jgi:hypothetical protein
MPPLLSDENGPEQVGEQSMFQEDRVFEQTCQKVPFAQQKRPEFVKDRFLNIHRLQSDSSSEKLFQILPNILEAFRRFRSLALLLLGLLCAGGLDPFLRRFEGRQARVRV